MDILNIDTCRPKKTTSVGLLLKKYLLLFSFLFSYGALGQTPAPSAILERQVKAAYLYKFASYVEWPGEAFSNNAVPLVIGIIGWDALADELAHIVDGHTVNGRPVRVRKLKRGDSLTGLHVLFIGQSENQHLAEIFAEARNKPLLTVTDSEEGHAHGSMINFVIVDDRLRFEVALVPVNLSGLKISARMLAAAYRVTPKPS